MRLVCLGFVWTAAVRILLGTCAQGTRTHALAGVLMLVHVLSLVDISQEIKHDPAWLHRCMSQKCSQHDAAQILQLGSFAVQNLWQG